MGGLGSRLPAVSRTMLVATLAITGIPIFAGFFSKDAILSYAFASGHTTIWAVGVVVAFLTAYYMFRLYFVVFVAPNHRSSQSPQSSSFTPLPRSMIWPLFVLAAGSLFLGFWNLPEAYGGGSWFSHGLHLADHEAHLPFAEEYVLDGLNVLVALFGIAVAYRKFVRPAHPLNPPVHRIAWQSSLANTLYIDTLYDRLIVRPLRGLSDLQDRLIDPKIIDGSLRGLVALYRGVAAQSARLQNGNLRWYALTFLLGVSGISLYLLIAIGGAS